jgi:hypothetical protein
MEHVPEDRFIRLQCEPNHGRIAVEVLYMVPGSEVLDLHRFERADQRSSAWRLLRSHVVRVPLADFRSSLSNSAVAWHFNAQSVLLSSQSGSRAVLLIGRLATERSSLQFSPRAAFTPESSNRLSDPCWGCKALPFEHSLTLLMYSMLRV